MEAEIPQIACAAEGAGLRRNELNGRAQCNAVELVWTQWSSHTSRKCTVNRIGTILASSFCLFGTNRFSDHTSNPGKELRPAKASGLFSAPNCSVLCEPACLHASCACYTLVSLADSARLQLKGSRHSESRMSSETPPGSQVESSQPVDAGEPSGKGEKRKREEEDDGEQKKEKKKKHKKKDKDQDAGGEVRLRLCSQVEGSPR